MKLLWIFLLILVSLNFLLVNGDRYNDDDDEEENEEENEDDEENYTIKIG